MGFLEKVYVCQIYEEKKQGNVLLLSDCSELWFKDYDISIEVPDGFYPF